MTGVTTLFSPNNRLFTLARQGRHQASALGAIAVVLVILAFAVIPGQMLGRALTRLTPAEIRSMAGSIIESMTGFLPIYLGLWVWLRVSGKRPFWTLGFERQGGFKKALRGAFVAGSMMAVTVVLAIIPGTAVESGALGIGLFSLLGYLVQGPAEEVLFRGWLLQSIGTRYQPLIGVLVSSLVFSLAHAGSHGITPLAFLNLFLFGAFAAVYALTEGGLWGISVWHAVWNWAQGDLLGFAVDGSPHRGLLVSIRTTSPDIISGGTFGLEGGLACTSVFLIAIGVVLLRAFYLRPEPSPELLGGG